MIKNSLIYFILGVSGWLSYLSFAPYHMIYTSIFAVCVFFMCLRHSPCAKRALLYGNIFGFWWFFGQLDWVSRSFEIADITYLALPASILFCLFLSFFMWIPAYIAHKYRNNPTLLWLGFSLGWSLSECLRTHIFGGFPWNLIGQVWQISLLQATAFIGIQGLSLLTILLFSSLVYYKKRLMAVIWILVGMFWYHHVVELQKPPQLTEISMRLVQPSIPQKDKWNRELFSDHMKKLVALSRQDWKDDLDAIIWPESAVPEFIQQDDELIHVLSKQVLMYHPADCIWITGIPTFNGESLHNSVLITDKDLSFKQFYHKVHLVPFGEFIPLRGLLPLNKFTHGTVDYISGNNTHYMDIKNLPPFATLICYEVIFPSVLDAEEKRPQWILNLTNDAWFGDSIGPHQHLHMARTRAIEQGLPVVRATNDGISAIIDSQGRLLHTLKKHVVGIIDFKLPKAGHETFVSKWGANTIYFAMLIAMGILFYGCMIQSARAKK